MAAVLLLSMFAARVLAATHHHDLVEAEQRECAACLMAATPAVEAPPPLSLPPPALHALARAASGPVALRSESFPFSVPLACGPPA